MNISERLEAVAGRIEEAARKTGRDPGAIKLIAVSKTQSIDAIRSACIAGQYRFGESRIQEAESKIASITNPAEWHMIGHLQSNKTKTAVKLFDIIHSVDSVHLVDGLNKQAAQIAKILPIFLQVNIADEPSKSGVSVALLPGLIRVAMAARSLKLVGLMVIPPFFKDPECSRPYFRRLRLIAFEELVAKRYVDEAQLELSMGMSNDYHVAIEEGATMVRVGTAIFGSR